jgi:hypothetical protein
MKEGLGLEYGEVSRFVDLYGARELRYKAKDQDINYEGVITRKSGTPLVKSLPKINPQLLTQLLSCVIFLRFDEMGLPLPSYKEYAERVPFYDNPDFHSYMDKLRSIVTSRQKDSARYLGEFATAGLVIPDLPNAARSDKNVSYDPNIARTVEEQARIGAQFLLPRTPKEERLIELARENLKEGRKVLVYITYTKLGTLEAVERVLKEAFPDKTIRSLPDSVVPSKRETWLRNNPNDILLTNPEKVKTGLDLLEYPTIIFFQPTYKIFTLRQARRRSWRIGQKNDVRVYFLVYAGTPQDYALGHISKKLLAANSIEGYLGDADISEDADDGENIALAMAKAILAGEKASEFKGEELQLGERELDVFEAFYRSIRDHEVTREQETPEATATTQTPLASVISALKGDLAEKEETLANEDRDTNEDRDRKIEIFRVVTRNKRKVEERLRLTLEEIDDWVARGELSGYTRSLFDL